MRCPKRSAEDDGHSTMKRSSSSIVTSRMTEAQDKDDEEDRGRMIHVRHRGDTVGSIVMRRKGTPMKEEDDGVWISVDIAKDGYFWRKYGEKTVLSDTDNPKIRSYFKCGEESVDGRHCPARKCIDWNVKVRPITSSVTYTLNHTHPPSDNPRGSIRPMRKLKVPSSLMASPTAPMSTSGSTSLPPRISNCQKIRGCIRSPSNLLKFPQVPSSTGNPHDQTVDPRTQGPDSHESSNALHNLASGSPLEANREIMGDSSVHQDTAFRATIDTAVEFHQPQHPLEGTLGRHMADAHALSHDPPPSSWRMSDRFDTDDLHAVVASATRHIRSATSGACGTLQESRYLPQVSVFPASRNMELNAVGVGASAHLGNGSPVWSQAGSDLLGADAAQASWLATEGSLDALSGKSVPPGASPSPSPELSGSASQLSLAAVTRVTNKCSELDGKLDVEGPVTHLSPWPQVGFDLEAGKSVHSQVFKIAQKGSMRGELDALLKPAPSPSPIPSAFGSVGKLSPNSTPLGVQEKGLFFPLNLKEKFHLMEESEMHPSSSAPVAPEPSQDHPTPSQSVSDEKFSLPCELQQLLALIQGDPTSDLFPQLQLTELCPSSLPCTDDMEEMVNRGHTSPHRMAPTQQLEIEDQQKNECNLHHVKNQQLVHRWEQQQQDEHGPILKMQVEQLHQEKQQQQFQLQLQRLEVQLEVQSQLLAKEQYEKERISQAILQHLHLHDSVCGKAHDDEVLASPHLQPSLERVCLHLILSGLSILSSH